MIRKHVNEKKLTQLLIISFIAAILLACIKNRGMYGPTILGRYGFFLFIEVLLPYLFFLWLYVLWLRQIGLFLFRSVTQKVNISLESLLRGWMQPKLILVVLGVLFLPRSAKYVEIGIEKINTILKLKIPSHLSSQVQVIFTQSTGLAYKLLLLTITTIFGYIAFNVYTKQLMKFNYIRREIIRPLDDLFSICPYFVFSYFIYLVGLI